MSTDEQMAAIGRLTVERAEAKRVCALLEDEAGKYRERFSHMSTSLSYLSDEVRVTKLASDVDAVIAMGGADRLRQLLFEFRQATRRVAEIGQTLRNAGAE